MPSRYGFRIVCPQINMPAAISKKNTPNQRRRTSAGLAGTARSYHVAIVFPSGKICTAPARAHFSFRESESQAKSSKFQTPSSPSSKLKNRPARRLPRHQFWRFGVLGVGTSLELGVWCWVFQSAVAQNRRCGLLPLSTSHLAPATELASKNILHSTGVLIAFPCFLAETGRRCFGKSHQLAGEGIRESDFAPGFFLIVYATIHLRPLPMEGG